MVNLFIITLHRCMNLEVFRPDEALANHAPVNVFSTSHDGIIELQGDVDIKFLEKEDVFLKASGDEIRPTEIKTRRGETVEFYAHGSKRDNCFWIMPKHPNASQTCTLDIQSSETEWKVIDEDDCSDYLDDRYIH